MSKFWIGFDRICGFISALCTFGCLYYARVGYLEAPAKPDVSSGAVNSYLPAILLGFLAVASLIAIVARSYVSRWLRERGLQKKDSASSVSARAGLMFGGRADNKKQLVADIIGELGADEQSWLRRMVVTGRPNFIPEATWQSLEKSGLVERDFSGPKGIRPEFQSIVEEWYGEHPGRLQHAAAK